jgi:hypothetical protein
MITVDVRTVKAGKSYRATVLRDGQEQGRYSLLLGDDAHVWIYTATANLGGYQLDRFGGKLTPVAIRRFFGYGT